MFKTSKQRDYLSTQPFSHSNDNVAAVPLAMNLAPFTARLFGPPPVFASECRLDDALLRAEYANAMWGLPAPVCAGPARYDALWMFERYLHAPLPRSYRRTLELTDGVAWLWKRVWLLSVADLHLDSQGGERAFQLKRKFRSEPRIARGLVVGLALDPSCDAMLLLDLQRSASGECPLWAFDGAGFVEHQSFGVFLDQLGGCLPS